MNARKLLSAAKAVEAAYIEDVFSTYLYTGTGSTQTITNGIDLAGKGGMVWIKQRSGAGANNWIGTTDLGVNQRLSTNLTNALTSDASRFNAFYTNGFETGINNSTSAETFVSWTFRKQAKFFDVVTYTGNGANRTISHNLGSVPGCIIVKRTDTTADWQVYHRSIANTEYLVLNTTAAKATGATRWNSTTATSTEFSLGTDTTVNANTGTYVAYLFAHDAGGFGASGSDNVISCGSFTTDGSGNATVTLGYEPQWLMVKSTSAGASNPDWIMQDSMRGLLGDNTNPGKRLFANSSAAEATEYTAALATGFRVAGLGTSTSFIYIAIRRGPMKTPTTGTSVFAPATRTGTGTTATVTTTISPVDMLFSTNRDRVASSVNSFWDRLRGGGVYLNSNATSAEASNTSVSGFDVQNGVTMQGGLITNGNSYPYVNWNFRRAPGFFDVVCYTGNGTNNRSIQHNLTIAPEIAIFKTRSQASDWDVYVASVWESINRNYLRLNTTGGAGNSNGDLFPSAFTATNLFVNSSSEVNGSGATYVAYLFATVAGVSKVGSYTGTGTTKQIDCGFTGGARFVLIKRTDSTGDWYVWDSARGIVAGNDPYLLLNSTAAEVTSTDYVDTYSAGFEISSTAPAAINANGGSFIFLAIA